MTRIARNVPAGTVIWAAGVKPSPLGATLEAALDREGRVAVSADLSLPGHPHTFIAGDMVSFEIAPGKLLPGVEVMPHYYLSGSPLSLALTLHHTQKNILVGLLIAERFLEFEALIPIFVYSSFQSFVAIVPLVGWRVLARYGLLVGPEEPARLEPSRSYGSAVH